MRSMHYLQKVCFWGCLLFLLAVFGAGCDDNSNPARPTENPDLLETIETRDNLSVLYELIQETSLSATFTGAGMKTIFVPSNTAFENLPEGYLESLTTEQKKDLLRYHIYNADYPVINEIKREGIPSLHGDPIFIELGQSVGNLINNHAKFLSTNIETTNGRIHIIDQVLLPDQFGTLFDNIKKRYEYRKFVERLELAGLSDMLREAGNKTLLTTSDAALDYYETTAGLSFSEEEWKEIMEYHILGEDISVTGPGTRMALVTMSGDSVFLTVDEPGKHNINGYGDPYIMINATNGKIFTTAGIMLPDKHLGILTVMDKRFYVQTARSALAVAKMTGRLYNALNNADEQFTIFIPGNSARGISAMPTTEAEVANILQYHVLLEKLTVDQLQHNGVYTTWQGEQITITRNGDQILINGEAAITVADLEGNNGVVHVIDEVLAPSSN